MVRKHLGFENFHFSRVFDDYYKIKNIKRSGWVKRGINSGESVADHSYGAYLLALFLLPDKWKEADYNKQRIINMLLVHDLAEAITGDILPDDSNEESKQREREVYEEIGVLGTYEGLGSMREVAEMWKEFEARTTLNAQVAKDIDKLENLVQLWVYEAAGHKIGDFDRWNKQLIDAVKTGPGIQVLEKLLKSHKEKTGIAYVKET
jgi:putative hydrolase of HD superfamily